MALLWTNRQVAWIKESHASFLCLGINGMRFYRHMIIRVIYIILKEGSILNMCKLPFCLRYE